ncbi:NAD-dependent succinate-semialdehyde dehydrogenase [Shewanella chilikensis]|jgi:succinate-semialdehyde dehydrogenase/glutarate-semialdehyde dehydrogenase|uniref:Succinate-semialdehyde dehydrogenase [NADP(+)] 1 n=4 Tax=Gammaproteobacteria TaxID=1236 RepID=A0A379YPT9_9GAMM|nr:MULTISPECIES: NAD-dependent succinate-semialdehyde dehydrogenase [Gammaproteobacteria]EHG7593073.1 NAD-dependent succinate-semialdehyde dehydrogenase [Salmonella enterica]EFB72087.1 aldehyde dehydrogenase (NAD) family protein [Providencia rustigianii DSM 4541]EHG7629600.1 NAD-dependent succinate-semialdehyde dehydrogenase [Salmonella enterica]EHG7634053.1 NAD-dependent succinate-semialdehyde dehydrogenase [Salmonella enterica]MBO2609880.1 NAD-dependent succinate-semialdehyde dehydrogenase [|tara:strand:+ start:6803 stop:8194 length:1392 start_codon:yes stop_codon:yes gene_type:complete
MAYETRNPYTGELLEAYPDATDTEVNQAIENAHAAFLLWKETEFAERACVMHSAATILRRDVDFFAKLLTVEMGKLVSEAKAEIALSADIFDYYANNAEALLAPEKLPVANPDEGDAVLSAEPLGVLLAIEPWNFPFYQVARIAAPQLSAGNTMLLKHASNVPQAAAAFEKLMLEAGLPQGAFKNLYATRSQIETIINDPRVHGVALTGSEGAGSIVASQAGKALKKSTLELGGADAFVVLADAEMEKTINWAVFGRHWNGGQVCVSSKRMIVVDDVYDQFFEGYTAGVAKLRAGDPADPTTTLAPLSSEAAANEIKDKIRQAVFYGATATEVGPKVPSSGAFVQPTILTNLSEDNPARYWEFFGPVSMLFRAKDEVDAIRIANDSPFGLGGSVFTADPKRGADVAKQISTGMVFVNHPTMAKADLPFGGIGRSGYGRELIGLGIREFVNHKLISVVDIDAPF